MKNAKTVLVIAIVGCAYHDGLGKLANGELQCSVPDGKCPSGFHCAADKTCWRDGTDPACDDAAKNGLETDLDCGGGECPACGAGRACRAARDCTSGLCMGGACVQAPGCGDMLKNGDETDMDCGGSCAACADRKACRQGRDCISMVCKDLACQKNSCSDGVKNGSETDVDCGRYCPVDRRCGTGKKCTYDSDCDKAVGLACMGGVCL